MRIRLRPGVHYARVREGVYVGAPRTHFVIRGPGRLFRVLDELIPLLEDGTTEDEAVLALRDTAAPGLVRQVIAALRARGLFLDLSRLSEPEPDADTRRRHAGALADLETDSDDPYAAFARLRAARVLLAGPPAAVLPAARGLLRAGVTRLLLAVPEPAAARPLADRAPGVEVTGLVDGKIASEVGDVDAAMYVAADVGLLDLQRAELPEGCPTVPVLSGGPLAVVGPPVPGPRDAAVWPALCARAHRWQAEGDLEPVALPAGEALAGALAGQSIFRALTGTEREGEAHVIWGGLLTADAVRIAPARPAPEPGARYDLDAIGAGEAPPVGGTLDAVHAASARWLGRFTVITPEDLPQLPVAQVSAEHRAGPGGEVLAWAMDQEMATSAVGLACLREQAAPAAPADDAVGAAGTTVARWLLDGALRLLARDLALESALGYPDVEDLGSRRLWRAIEDYELVPVALELYGIDGVAWRLGRLVRGDTGETLARAWGPDGPQAVRAALGTGVARLQALRTRGRDPGPGSAADTSALTLAPDADIAALLDQVRALCRRQGITITGREAAPDPLLGALDLRHGAVRLERHAKDAGDAR
jgi:hypothetical protein